MSITCIKGGTLASFQDEGRIGHQNLGIIVSGAMDSYALKIANIIVGNTRSSACLEITMRGTILRADKDMLIAITGGDLHPVIDHIPVPQWRPVFIKAGSILKFKGAITGLRSYLAVSGGFSLEDFLGSHSTYLRAKVGGFKGRALQVDDRIEIGQVTSQRLAMTQQLATDTIGAFNGTSWHVRPDFYKKNRSTFMIRFIKGPEYDWFNEESQQKFTLQQYTIASSSDRMGYRLEGQSLEKISDSEMVSEAIANGTVQISNNGLPIVLLADRQTTGGYPRVAQICTADLYKFGQMKPADKIHFKEISLNEAYKELAELERTLRQIELSITFKTNGGSVRENQEKP